MGAKFRQGCRATALVSVLFAAPAYATEDFATFFAEDYEGISLSLVDPQKIQVPRPQATDLTRFVLPGFPLSAEELSLVLRLTDPVGFSANSEAVRPSFRERLGSWLGRDWMRQKDTSVFSALVRDENETGMRVDFDPAAEEVVVEYRVGF